MHTESSPHSTSLRRTRLALVTGLAIGATWLTAGSSVAGIAMPVTSLGDTDVNDAVCTLREAILSANMGVSRNGCTFVSGSGGTDTILLPSGTITLTSTLPAVTTFVTIAGGGYTATFIDGGNTSLIGQWVLDSGNVVVRDVTLQNFSNGALFIKAGGTAAFSHGKIFKSGNATSQGGCVTVLGDFFLEFAQLESCTAHTGGAIRNSGGGLFMSETTVLKSHGEHGIIATDTNGLTTISASTIAANSVGGTIASGEGAIYNLAAGRTFIFGSTIAYNKKFSSSSAGGATSINNVNGVVEVSSSVVFGNQTSTVDCAGTVTSRGFNAFVTGRGCTAAATDLFPSDPDLQPLTTTEGGSSGIQFTNLPRAAGGIGRVYLPGVSSPLLGKVPQTGGFLPDQRGIDRNKLPTSDIGAVERTPALLVVGNTTLSAGDTNIKAQLEAVGFVVTVVADTSSSSASANGKEIVVISETVGSSSVTTKFRNVSVGVLVLEPLLYDDMMMTTTANLGTANSTQTNLLRGLLSSKIGFFGSTPLSISKIYGWGTPAASASVHTRSTVNSSQSHIFEYRPFSMMAGGFVAPASRVGMFATDNVSGALNTTGNRLLQESAIRAASAGQ